MQETQKADVCEIINRAINVECEDKMIITFIFKVLKENLVNFDVKDLIFQKIIKFFEILKSKNIFNDVKICENIIELIQGLNDNNYSNEERGKKLENIKLQLNGVIDILCDD